MIEQEEFGVVVVATTFDIHSQIYFSLRATEIQSGGSEDIELKEWHINL